MNKKSQIFLRLTIALKDAMNVGAFVIPRLLPVIIVIVCGALMTLRRIIIVFVVVFVVFVVVFCVWTNIVLCGQLQRVASFLFGMYNHHHVEMIV